MTGTMERSILDSVSRETTQDLEAFAGLVRKWNPAVNLVSRSSLGQLMERHIGDSLQLCRVVAGPIAHWADLGSGGGFPGIVVAILAKHTGLVNRVTLVESDKRKASFLGEAVRALRLPAVICAERITDVPCLSADVISARALAPLSALCGFAALHLAPKGLAIFPKGATYLSEIEDARRNWTFNLEIKPSATDPSAAILCMKDVAHV